jgi:hypothetical protein
VGKRLVLIAVFTGAIRKENAGNRTVIKTVCESGLHRVFIGFMGFVVWVGLFQGESLHVFISCQNLLWAQLDRATDDLPLRIIRRIHIGHLRPLTGI